MTEKAEKPPAEKSTDEPHNMREPGWSNARPTPEHPIAEPPDRERPEPKKKNADA